MALGRKPKLSPQQRAEIRLLAGQGERSASLALEYGVSETTIRRAAGREAIDHRRKPVGPCVVCGRTKTKVLRFGLTIHPAGARSARGAGSIDLCERDWRLIGKPRMRVKLKLDKMS